MESEICFVEGELMDTTSEVHYIEGELMNTMEVQFVEGELMDTRTITVQDLLQKQLNHLYYEELAQHLDGWQHVPFNAEPKIYTETDMKNILENAQDNWERENSTEEVTHAELTKADVQEMIADGNKVILQRIDALQAHMDKYAAKHVTEARNKVKEIIGKFPDPVLPNVIQA